MIAALYSRVSTVDQEREGTSLGTQEEACRKYAEEKGYEVQENYVIKEVYSGLVLERPELTQLRNWVRNNEVDGVVVYSTDRLSRDPIHLLFLVEEIEKKGIKLHFITEPHDSSMEGQLLSFIRGWASKLEALKIAERTTRGKRARALSGKIPSGSHVGLFGYHYIPGKGEGEGIRSINEDEARWIQEMFRWLVEEGLSTNAIVYRLRDYGVPTPSGKGVWNKRTIQKLLRNPAYYGKTYAFTCTLGEPKKRIKPNAKTRKTGVNWKPREEWIEIPNATPPIISEELFEAAQRQLQRNKELATRNTKYRYLLKGHIYCRKCGRGYWASTRGGGIRSYRYYRCSGNVNIVTPVKCGNRNTNADPLEALIWGQIEAILAKPELVVTELKRRQQESSEVAVVERNVQRVEGQLANREKQKARAWKAFEITGDEETFKVNIAQLEEEITALKEEQERLQKRIEAGNRFGLNIQDLERACELVKRNVKGLSYEEKRLTLEALQIKVWIDGDDVAIEGAIPLAKEDIECPISP